MVLSACEGGVQQEGGIGIGIGTAGSGGVRGSGQGALGCIDSSRSSGS